MHTLLSRTLQPVKDFLFPPLCLACRERLASAEEYLCARCSRSLVHVDAADYTMTVLNERFAASGIVSALHPLYYFEEEGALQSVIHALKYEDMTRLGEVYGEELGASLSAEPVCADARLIIPVPLHAQKERERGYNQSSYICAGIARVLTLPIARNIVSRRKNTRSQTKLSAAARLENVKDAFNVDARAAAVLRGAAVILVDDVMTTGATMHSCALALRTAGAAQIVCASIGVAKLAPGRLPPV
jgi:ComF family protein